MKQQTAVEWLLENIHIIPKFNLSVQDTIDKAKQMEKEQTINFAKKCLDKALDLDIRTVSSKVEDYYDQTYNQDK